MDEGEPAPLSDAPAPARRAVLHPLLDRRVGSVVALALCVLFGLCWLAALSRGYAREELLRTSAWCCIVLAAYVGWGTALSGLTGQRGESVALRAVWGASLLTFAGGVLAAASLLSRALLHLLITSGVGLLVLHVARRRQALGRALRAGCRATRKEPARGLALVGLSMLAAVQIFGGASDFSSNPYDDNIAYYPFAKQLLEHGTLIDPFSFRRLGTLGGQALQHAALLLEVPLLALNAFDRSICLSLALGLLASQRIGGRRAPFFARVLAALTLLCLPNISINSASHYAGLVLFLGLYQTLERLPDVASVASRALVRRLAPLALTAAMACTLRQNYVATVGLFLAISYGFVLLRRRRDTAFRAVLVEPVVCFGMLAAALLPWLVLEYRSSQTALFPLWPGTFNPDVALASEWHSFSKLLRFDWHIWLHADPFYALPVLALAGLAVRERTRRSPLASLWLGTALVILLSCTSLSLMDPQNLTRYCFGFVAASVLVGWLSAAAHFRSDPSVAVVMATALIVTLTRNEARTLEMLDTRVADLAELLRRTTPAEAQPASALAYGDLQARIPKGARLLVMLDEPYRLDFSRNEIFNLDLPGIASPAPGMPCFQGAEALAGYLHQQGIRYLAFVNPERSTVAYRRSSWFPRIFGEEQIWRVYAPYLVNVMDNVAELGESRMPLAEADGMVLLDLDVRRR